MRNCRSGQEIFTFSVACSGPLTFLLINNFASGLQLIKQTVYQTLQLNLICSTSDGNFLPFFSPNQMLQKQTFYSENKSRSNSRQLFCVKCWIILMVYVLTAILLYCFEVFWHNMDMLCGRGLTQMLLSYSLLAATYTTVFKGNLPAFRKSILQSAVSYQAGRNKLWSHYSRQR